MRIAIKATGVGGDGIGYYIRTLMEGLGTSGSDYEFVLLTDSLELISASEQWPNVEAARIEDFSPWWEQFRLPDWLEERAIDLYHSPAFSLPLVKTCHYMPTVHDCIPVLFPELVGPDFTHYFGHYAPGWFKTADHLLCNSHHTAHDLIHLYGVAPGDVSVVYHTGNASMRRAGPESLAEVRQKLGIDRPFILAVGRVELRKNVEGMLQAHHSLSQMDIEPPLLVFAGARVSNAFDPEGLLPPVGKHGNVVVTGLIPEEELAALYSSAAVYCFPTFYEGFGRPVLEAMQCGAPVVTTRVSSLPEVGGDACLYVSPYDPEELAHALYRVLTDAALCSELVAKGVKRAGEFTVERMTRETLAVYEKVMSIGDDAPRSRRRWATQQTRKPA